MAERELVKIVSNIKAHPHGYYTQFKDQMKPGDVEYVEGKEETRPPAEPVKQKRGKKKS